MERMKQSKGISSWVWLTIGLIGLGLNVYDGYLCAHQGQAAALELHGTISN